MIFANRLTFTQRRDFFFALLAGLALAALFLFAIIHIHEDLSHPRIEALDRTILQDIHTHDTPTLTRLAKTLSFIGSPALLLPAILLAAGLLWVGHLRRDAILLLLAMGGASVLDTALKLHYRRVRPDVPWAFVHERSFSFPSGHSVFAVVLYGIITWLTIQHITRVGERVALLLVSLLLIAGIGLSRIYLGVHYPSDVATGYFVGATWLLAVIAADKTLRRRRLSLRSV